MWKLQNREGQKMGTASATKLELRGLGLNGTAGADIAISHINLRKGTVSDIDIGRNGLGDYAGERVLKHILTMVPLKNIRSLNMDSCAIGNNSFRLICLILQDNRSLEILSIQSNSFNPASTDVDDFVSALNGSHLRKLTISSNKQLGDIFIERFLGSLHAKRLRELAISVLGLTSTAQGPIASFISSPRSRSLRALIVTGNDLFVPDFFQQLIDLMLTGKNFSLVNVDTFGNSIQPSSNKDQGNDTLYDAARARSQEIVLQRLFQRNKLYCDVVANQALQLIPYARVIFLHPRLSAVRQVEESPDCSGFLSLPNEIKIQILHHVSPILSSAQCHRICSYAADRSNASVLRLQLSRTTPPSRKQEREDWLTTVQCETFEPWEDWETVMQEILAQFTSQS